MRRLDRRGRRGSEDRELEEQPQETAREDLKGDSVRV